MSKKAETTDAGPVRGPQEPAPSPLGAVAALMEERRRFESWIAGLDARRDATPPRVFARVHADYTVRLEAVVARLTSHVDELRGEMDRLTAQLESAHDEQQQARDARAESELRAHVGELSPEDWEATAQAADERIDALISRHADLETELLRTRELLANAERPATPHLGTDTIPEAPVAGPARAGDGAHAPDDESASDDGAERSAPAKSAEPAEPAEPAETAKSAGVDGASKPVAAAQAQLLLDGPSSPSSGERPAGTRRGGSASFDEMAFLNSVVDAPGGTKKGVATGAPVPAKLEGKGAPPPRRDSFPVRASEAGIENADATAADSILDAGMSDVRPLAANISGNHPIILRDKPMESVKTLKCADCGAMNYPTEWYCEKCGAELASL